MNIKINLLVIGTLILLCTGCNWDTWDLYDTGEVTKTFDGDTVEVKTKSGQKFTLDLALIRTPDPEDPYGKQAMKILKGYEDKWFDIDIKAEKQKDGTYQGFITDLTDNNASLVLVKEGLAIVKVEGKGFWYQSEVDEFFAAQEEAKKKKKGIWSIEGYVKDDGFDTQLANKVFAERKAEEQKKKDLAAAQLQASQQKVKDWFTEHQKESNGKISSIKYEIGDKKQLGDESVLMNVTVFVSEEHWASMTEDQKLSFVTVSGTKIPNGINSLQVLGKSSAIFVYFRSDEIQDVLAKEKRGRWYLVREDYPSNKKKDDERRKKKGYGYWHR